MKILVIQYYLGNNSPKPRPCSVQIPLFTILHLQVVEPRHAEADVLGRSRLCQRVWLQTPSIILVHTLLRTLSLGVVGALPSSAFSSEGLIFSAGACRHNPTPWHDRRGDKRWKDCRTSLPNSLRVSRKWHQDGWICFLLSLRNEFCHLGIKSPDTFPSGAHREAGHNSETRAWLCP